MKYLFFITILFFTFDLNGQGIEVNAIKINDITCFSSFPCDGSATFEINWGNIPITNYDVEWSSGEISDTSSFLCNGWQYLSVFIGNENFTDSILIVKPSQIFIEANVKDETCFGDNDGAISITNVTGGTPPYQIEWSDGSDLYDRFNLMDGEYSVIVSDSNNCLFNSSFDIKSAIDIDLSYNESSSIEPNCYLDSNGIINVIANPFVTIQKYVWIPDVSESNYALDIPGGEYEVIVTGSNGCKDSVSISFPQPPPINIDLEFEPKICLGSLAKFGLINDSENGDLIFSLNSTLINDTLLNLEGGQYTLSISDQNGCTTEESFLIEYYSQSEIDGPEEVKIVESLTENVNYEFVSEYSLDSIYWQGSVEGLTCIDCLNQTFTGVNDENYIIKVIDENGCKTEKLVEIKVDKGGDLFYPNIFSPNQDGVNDEFIAYFQYPITDVKQFLVFDRFGNKVCSEPNEVFDNYFTWDGLFRDNQLEIGVYSFILKLLDEAGNVITRNGTVQIIY
jgi:gliding motility-associated-like protein